jgi:hypothetical protein
MKVKIKEMYKRGDKTELPSDVPVASMVITNDTDEYLYEFFITKSNYDDIKRRERKYEEAKEMKEKAAKREDLLIEYLAEIEHEQWCKWSRELAKKEPISETRRARWESFWIPYGLLSDETKEEDRKWARKVLKTVRVNEDFWMKKDTKDKQNREVATQFMDELTLLTSWLRVE